jgi:hypothetical protein
MPTPANSINESGSIGTVQFDGVATFSTVNGSAGQILTSNGPTNAPTYQTSASTNSIARTFLLMGG